MIVVGELRHSGGCIFKISGLKRFCHSAAAFVQSGERKVPADPFERMDKAQCFFVIPVLQGRFQRAEAFVV